MYLVAAPQVLEILAGEPRFLSISPDTGLIELDASETSENVRRLALHEIQRLGYSNQTAFAAPLVTGVWFDEGSYVESPAVYVKQDGSRVTSFDLSLAMWADVERDDLVLDEPEQLDRREKAWEKVFRKLREAEADEESKTPYPVKCQDQIRFGVSSDHLRLNYPWTQDDVQLVDFRDEL